MLHTQPMAPTAPPTHPAAMLEALLSKAQAQLALYRSEPNRMLSDFNRERELIGEYNGRQLLEMLQNADDQGSKRVLIEWDETARRLAISNEGAPFSVQGFESLLLSNLSTKTGGGYIGNKGLGFRSIVNWASDIAISSGGLCATFAERIVHAEFARMFTPDQQAELRARRSLASHAVPMAFLSVPELRTIAPGDWSTTIAIVCREGFVNHIRSQLDELTPQCLLFLHHIDRIEIRSNGHSHVLERQVDGAIVTINGQPWTIYSDEEQLPEHLRNLEKAEPERYSLKLALAPGLRDGARTLYTFFPTRVGVNFPMVVHGTFELDASRNQLIVSERNKYILEQLVELIVDTAQGLATQGDGWLQVRLMRYTDTNPVLEKLGFYERIDAALATLPIFPCVDGVYRTKSQIYYLGAEFSQLVIEAGAGASFPGLACAGPENAHFSAGYLDLKQVPHFAASVRALSEALRAHDIALRVRLIEILHRLEPARHYAVLVNERNEVIEEEDTVFTPVTSASEQFVVPDLVRIDFMDRALYESLAAHFGIGPGSRARDLQQRLSGIARLHSYEPAQVFRRIITASTAALTAPHADARTIIVQTVEALFKNFVALGGEGSMAPENMRLLARDGQVRPARELVLSGDYPDGRHTERLFGAAYDDAMFLAPLQAFGPLLAGQDRTRLQTFFVWLGVGRHVRYEAAPLQVQEDFENFVFSMVERPDAYRHGQFEGRTVRQDDLARIIDTAAPESVVEWLLRDDDARQRLETGRSDKFRYRVKSDKSPYAHTLDRTPSYLLYQLRRAAIFEGFLIVDDPLIGFVNERAFDYATEGFAQLGVARPEIETVLLRLGARHDLAELEIGRIAAILRAMPDTDPHGRQAQKLYRLAANRYDKTGECLPSDVPLFARRGLEAAYRPQSEVHYAENSRLPRKIADRHWLLSYPRRGGAQKVPAFFGVHNLNKLEVTVVRAIGMATLTAQCEASLRERKPILLAYRIENLAKNRADAASRLVRLSIALCSELVCDVGGEQVALAVNEYIPGNAGNGWRYTIRVAPGQTLDGLRRDPAFCDAFADIVGSLFDVAEHQAEFRTAFKDHLDDVLHVAHERLSPELLDEARGLLGMMDPRTDFLASLARTWRGHDANMELSVGMRAVADVLAAAGIDIDEEMPVLPVDGVNAARLARIFEVLGVRPSVFDGVAHYKLQLAQYHRTCLESARHAAFPALRDALVMRLRDRDWDARGSLLAHLHAYDHEQGWIAAALRDHADSFTLDAQALLQRFVDERFNALADGMGSVTHVSATHAYEEQCRRLPDVASAALPPQQTGWLYFEGGLEKVVAWLAQQKETAPALEEHEPVVSVPLPETSAVPIAGAPAQPGPEGGPRSSSQPYKHTAAVDARNKASGMRAEAVVYESLVRVHGKECVEHVALRADGYGHDIRYSTDGRKTWKYVEVKRYTQGCIHLSENERRYAAEHRADYELFLVTGEDRIHILRDVNFEDSKSFRLAPTEYLIHFDLDEGA